MRSKPKKSLLQSGFVSRIDRGAGFGYVRDIDESHQYIFVFGGAINRSDTRDLNVGKAVEFEVTGQGRIKQLLVK